MTVQLGTTVRNAVLDAIETTIGASAILKIRTGAQPANCAAADSGTVLATLALPADWLNAASGGTITLKGTWQDASADASGTLAHFRLYDSGGATCHMQGSATVSGGGGDLTFDSASITAGQVVNVTLFTVTAPNA